MSGVYNRKLFRQSGARDELRKMGGIMSSSEELMREALMTAMQAPRPADLGPMPMPQQPVIGMPAPPVMQPQQPMDMGMQQPMDMGMQSPMDMGMGQPMDMGMQSPMDMGMQQPMDSGFGMQPSQPMMQQQPIQPPIAEPAYMPPTMPQSLQMEPAGFAGGGFVVGMYDNAPVDVGQTAGTVTSPVSVETAVGLDQRLEELPPYDVANTILEDARRKGVTTTTDPEDPEPDPEAVRFDLAKILDEMAGDPSAYEKNIDDLNRGIIGAAIAAGTSARATENIAKGMLVGLEGARATEERRAGDAQTLQLKALEVRAAEQAAREAGAKAETDAEGKLIKDMRDTFDTMYTTVFDAGVFAVPEGSGELNDYATQVARDKVVELYGAENAAKLFGSASSSEEPPPAAAQRTGTPPTLEQYTAMVKAKNPNVAMTGEEFEARYNSWVAQNYAGS
jgi:hypothetical protein